MKELRELAERLNKREKIPIVVSFRTQKRKEEIRAKFDPLFAAVELPGGTFPAREMKMWLRFLYAADPETVEIRKQDE
jgi:hypothetical protein